MGPQNRGRPSAFGYNATTANKEHREKKQLEWEKAERLAKDIAEYKKVEAVKEEELKKARRFGSSEVSVAGTGSVASTSANARTHDQASLVSFASQKHAHTAPVSPHGASAAASTAGSKQASRGFSYTHMLEEVEEERNEQEELALKATQLALANDPTRLPKFRNRTNQQIQQKPLRKLPNTNRIMATVAEQIVMGGNHVDALRHRPGYPMTNNELTIHAKK